MISIIAIGDFCCLIADKLSKYPQYEILKFSNTNSSSDNCIKLKYFDTAEEYEKNCPDVKKHIKSVKNSISIFLDGSEAISGIVLALAQQFSNKNIKIYYIKSDIDLMSELEKIQDRICFSVLRSE